MSKIESLIFYIVFLLLATFFYYLSNKSKTKTNRIAFLIISFVIPMLIGGLRKGVGTDYYTYISLFNNLQKNNELGFYYLCKFIKMFGDYKLMFFILNFLILALFYNFLSTIDKKDRVFVYYIYIFTLYITSYNAIRQVLAIEIVYLGYMCYKKNKINMFILLTIIATLFHVSSFFVIPFIYITRLRNNYIKVFLLVIVLFLCANFQYVILFLSRFDMFEKYYRLYYGQSITIGFNNLEFYIDLLLLIFVLLYRKRLIALDSFNNTLLYINCFDVAVLFTGFMNPYIKRMALFFKIGQFLLLSQITRVSSLKNNRMIYKITLSLYPILYFVLDYYVFMHSNIIPYNSIL